MTRYGILIISFLVFLSCAPFRTYNGAHIFFQVQIIEITEKHFVIDKQKLSGFYILDGVPYEQNKIDVVLSKVDKLDVRMITFLKVTTDNI